MPLYTDSSGIYWATSSSATSSNRDQYSSYLPGAYVSYSRPLTYSLPSTSSLRTNYSATSSRYRPKLSTITETPYNSRGLTSLTRINSPKVNTTGTTAYHHSSYVPQRPININTADIDVSEKRFKKHDDNNFQLGSITTIEEKNETKSNSISDSQTDLNNNSNTINENDEQEETNDNEVTGHFVNRSTIKRNRAVVRLSMSRPKNPYLNNNNENLLLAKKQKIEQVNGSDSSYTEPVPSNISTEESSLSWRQKVGEDLLKPLKTNKKSPGDIMREKHFIPIVDPKDETENENELQKMDDYSVPDNLKPIEGEPTDLIVEIDPLTHTAVRRLSIPRCPDFQDFCEDISSDRLDDDLNAGALRRRASLIQEQEIELMNQLQKSASGSVQLIHLERIENPSDLIPSGKRKSKKKRIRHKITATVEVDNPLPLLTAEESTSSELSPLSGLDQQGTPSGSESPKKSPKITYKVDEIEENHTTVVKLPKKKKKVVEKKLETIENNDAFKNSPKKMKVTKKVVPLKGRNGKVETMEEIPGEKPKQKKISDVINKPEVAKQSEMPPAKTPNLKASNVLDTSSEKVGIKTPSSVPASPLKKVKPLQTTKSAAEISTINNVLKTPLTPDYFKFDEESITKVQKDNLSSSTTKVETPKTFAEEKCKDSDKSSQDVKLRTKPKVAKKYERSDSGDDFWSNVGSRETIYFDRRKKSVIENLWNKRENLLDDEEMKDVSNLDAIKEKVSQQKNEELKEVTDYIDPTSQAENRRARSNEFSLCDKNKDAKQENKEKIQKTENANEVGDVKSPEKNLVDVNDKKLNKKITSPPQTPTVQTKIQDKNTAQQKSNNLPKISSDLDAKSPEIKTKINQNKKDIPISKSSSDVVAKLTTDALSGTPASPGLNKFVANKKDSENDAAIQEKEKISKAQVAKAINDVKSSAFTEQGKETIAKLNATNTDAKTKLLNKSDANKNKSETKIGSSLQSPTETIASSFASKDKLLTTTPVSPSAETNKKQTTENVSKQSTTNVNTKENKNLEKEKTNVSALSKNLPTTQKKIDDKDKIKTNIKSTTTTSCDDAITSVKNSSATDDVKTDNKFAKINTEISSDAKNKNKSNATATATTKTKTCDDKTTTKDTKKSENINETTATTTKAETTSDTTATTKLANNISDDKSIDNVGSNNNKKKKLKSNSNLNDTELKTTATSKGAVGERASQQLSFKKVLNKTKEQKLEEIQKGGNLQKFDTLSNLNEFLFDVDADIKDYKENNSSDSNNSDSYNSSCKSDTSSMKRKDKKQKQKLAAQEPEPFNRNRVKLDHGKKLYVKDEAANKYMLIATPRPLWKPEKFAYNSESSSDDSDDETTDSDDDSECETSSSGDDSGGEEDELNPHHKKNCLIRLSTCSNDSGFVGGTAPTNPKKMLGPHDARDSPSTPPSHNPAFKIESNYDADDETSYTYAQFQKTGRITAPATNIPRFKKYAVEDFHFLAVLGKGSFGKVLLAELRNSDYYYAVKCLKKDVVLEDDDVECTLIERKVLALGTKHPYLCHLFCTFQTESHLFFVMEYLNGGDLMFHIQQNGRFPEPRARFYGAEIVSGLKFLHKKGIIYRDLKLDNVLLDFEGHVRIADFGMCKLQIYLDKTADSFCGTPDYMAPEIIKGDNYNQNVDWWSFGVLLYEMLIGQSPFSGCDEEYLFWSICNEIPMYPMCLSQEATTLLKALLEKDSAKRIGSQYSPLGDILVHPFFVPIDWELLEKRQIEPPFKPQVKHPLDTKYFDKTFTRERVRLTPIDKEILHSMDQAQFQGFSYTNPNATLD